MLKVKILGSGCWEAIPAPFCKCRVCKSNDSKDNKTRPQILIETEKGQFLIEISPDIRLQSIKHNLNKISNFFISHWHFDHMYGLLELAAWSRIIMKGKINLFCSQKTKEWLEKYNFNHIPKKIISIKPFEKIKLLGTEITPLPVYHMFSQDKDLKENELDNVFGFLIEKDGKKIVYFPDYFKVPKKTLDMIKNLDAVIMDGTYLFEEEFPDKPEQNDLKNDHDHLHGKQILEFAKSLDAKKIFFHSISHLSEKTHKEMQKQLPADMFISYDGMEI
jgi:phosphoribosyl 1,2-cyclic phosphate phosphodiesterase